MPPQSDAAELRALQAKAYGRDGGLTEADATRLRALESVRAEAPPQPPAEPAAPDEPIVESFDVPRSTEGGSVQGIEPGQEDESEASDSGSHADGPGDGTTSPPASGLRVALRQHWKALAAASAAVLVIGLGAGWALFGQSGDAVALTPEQQERRADLQTAGEYDSGSLRAIGKDEDALVWYATKDDGDQVCLTIDTVDDSATQCHRAEDLDNGMGAGVSIMPQSSDEDEYPQQIWASAVRATNGELVAVIQRWDTSPDDWLMQFSGEERQRARELVEEGFEQYSFSVVGYFRDAPVWYGQRTEGANVQDCLAVDAVGAIRCVEAGDTAGTGQGIEVSGVIVDEAGETTEQWSVELAFTPSGTSYLIVSGDQSTSTPEQAVKPGETLELGGEYQDPIEVEVPSDDSEG